MKKINLHKSVALLLSLVMMVSILSGCGSESDTYVGSWTGITAYLEDLEIDIVEVYPGGFSFDLYEDGTGIMTVDDQIGQINWSQDDGMITISDTSGAFTGTLDDDCLVLKDVAGTGMDLVFQRK